MKTECEIVITLKWNLNHDIIRGPFWISTSEIEIPKYHIGMGENESDFFHAIFRCFFTSFD